MRRLMMLGWMMVMLGWLCRGEVKNEWTYDSVAPGVMLMSGAFDEVEILPGIRGCQRVSVLFADKNVKAGIGSRDVRVDPIGIAEDEGAVAAVNGSFFDMGRGNSLCYLRDGKELMDTTTAFWYGQGVNGAMVVKDGVLELMKWNKEVEREYADTAGMVLASGPVLVWNGEPADLSEAGRDLSEQRHPRTAVGLMADGSVMLVCVDGRRAGVAEGMTLRELGELMRELGAVGGMNLDGGGSSMMWTARKGVVSLPSDGQVRAVPNVVMIRK